MIVYRTSEEEEESKIVRFRIGRSMKRKKKEGSVVYRAIGNEEEMMFSEDQVMNEGRVTEVWIERSIK